MIGSLHYYKMWRFGLRQTVKTLAGDGLYIHGRAHHGSDGCIVPLDPRQFPDLAG
jgi:hypothetical protein